ncbi:DUF7151 family protein [Chryseobacterium luteum]|uniref:DUF7151 family protein n=1 Tax=Chryseobacterium luteum TaxID=421531 RepID=UPI00054F1A64|nr:hypothetical protein [Chryseobacterium luteum]
MKLKILSSILLFGSFFYVSAQYSGNVGINTTAPTATLNVKGKGNTTITQSLKVENSDGTNLLTINDNGTISGSAVSNFGGGGTNGINALVTTTTEVAGSNCSTGGVKIESGQDTNSNGILDASEIVSTRYVCNGSNGSNSTSLANGTTGGQIYLTGSAAPFSPQAPTTVTGDISISTTGSTTIATNAVNTAKINDLAVTTGKLADGSVTTAKISATGTASATTYLRGDGQWATPSSSGGTATGAIGVMATNTVEQVLPVGSSTTPVETPITFSSYTVGSVGTFDGTTFTATSAGVYLINTSLVSGNSSTTNPVAVRPSIRLGSNVIAHGVIGQSGNYPAGSRATGIVSTVVSLSVNDTISIVGINIQTNFTASTSTNGTTRLSIVKLF